MDTTELVRAGSNDELESAETMLLTEAQINALGREPLLHQLESAEQCILSLAGLYNQYEAEKGKLPEIEKKTGAIVTGSLSWLYIGIVWCGFSFAPVLSWLGDHRHGGFAVVCLLILIAGVRYFIRSAKKYAAGKEAHHAAGKEYYEREAALVAQKMKEIEDSTKSLIESVEYQNAVLLVPADYMDVGSISALLRILQNRRANSITEALNVYENDLHYRRLESAANRSADAQERAANAQERSANAQVLSASAQVQAASAQQRTAQAAEAQAAYAKKISKNTQSAARSAKELNAFVKRIR